MRFAKWVFTIAGIYGVLVTLPLYFLETYLGQTMPPALNHLEYYYGFIGVTLAWQFAFLIIGRDPQRFRIFMPVAMFEKFSFFISTLILFLSGRAPQQIMLTASIDCVLGVLFVISFYLTRKSSS